MKTKAATRVLSLVSVLLLSFGVCMMVRDNSVFAADNGSSVIQTRGVWHRPNSSGKETTLDGLRQVLDTFSAAGINTVFLETFYHGMTIFKTNRIPYYSGLENYSYGDYPDYLTAFATEAEARGIEVHCWVEDFYIGVNDKTALAVYHPDWLLVSQSGSVHQSEGSAYGGYMFLDPSNAEVRNYLVDFYDELLSKVPQVKGLNLDYIRYPVSSATDDTGFTQSAMSQFAAQNGFTLSATETRRNFINTLNSNNLQSEWTAFRAEIITGFVSQVFEMIKENHPEVLISTAIFPNAEEAYSTKKQNFSEWIKNGYLDIVTPMVYYYKDTEVGAAVKQMISQCSDCFCYTGLYATYHKQTEAELMAQIVASNKAGADGFVLFDSSKTFFENDYSEFLKENFGSLSSKSVLPHSASQEILQCLNDALSEFLLAEVAAGRENAGQVDAFLTKISQIGQIGESNIDALSQTVSQFSELSQNVSEYISDSNLSEVQTALKTVARFLNVRLERWKAKGLGADDPDVDPDVPTPPQPTPSPDNGTDDSNNSQTDGNVKAVLAVSVVSAAVIIASTLVFVFRRKRK